MIIDTDVVTSTSVKVKVEGKRKKGRESSDSALLPTPAAGSRGETLMNLPEHLVGNEILPQHILKRAGEPAAESEAGAVTLNSGAAPVIINNASKFRRYQIPPEVRVTHDQLPFRRGKEIGSDRYESDEHLPASADA